MAVHILLLHLDENVCRALTLPAACRCHVQSMYQQALGLHVVALAVCCTMGALFLLFIELPYFKRVLQESKRIAELFVCLPVELNVECLVAGACCCLAPPAVPSAHCAHHCRPLAAGALAANRGDPQVKANAAVTALIRAKEESAKSSKLGPCSKSMSIPKVSSAEY